MNFILNYSSYLKENYNDYEYSVGINRFYEDIINFFKINHPEDLNILYSNALPEYSFQIKIAKYELTIKFAKDKIGNLDGAEFGWFEDETINPYIKLYYSTNENIIDVLEANESNLKHEITHYFDYLKRNKTLSSSTVVLKNSGEKSYYNTVEEINAYFIQACTDVICMMNINKKIVIKNFYIFKKYFLSKISKFYENLNDVNRNLVDKRMYAFYDRVKKI